MKSQKPFYQRPWVLMGGALTLAAGLILFAVFACAPVAAPAPSQELLAFSHGLDEISIKARFEPDQHRLQVSQRLTLQNRESLPRDMVVLRTYANAFQREDTSPAATEELYEGCYPEGFSPGSLVLSSVRVGLGGQVPSPVQHRYKDAAKTVLSIPLASPWNPGASLSLELAYTLNVPQGAMRFGENSGIWALGNCFPLPALFQEGAYREDPYYPVGDPFLSECMNFTVDVTVPSGYVCAGSAFPAVTSQEDHTVYHFEAPVVRDFALCLSTGYQQAQAVQEGVQVLAYAQEKSQAQEALGYAKQALACFTKRFGAYPYPAFTLAEVDFPFGGMEYPSLVMLSSDTLAQGGQDLEFLVVHETAHQWWYGVVGSDSVAQPWQDEALCEYSLLPYVETYYGPEARKDTQFTRFETAMRVTVPKGVTPASPLSYFSDMSEYGLVVYRRGAALFCALDTALEGKLDDFLNAYYDRERFQLATRKDFSSLLADYTGQDWGPLMTDYLDTYLGP